MSLRCWLFGHDWAGSFWAYVLGSDRDACARCDATREFVAERPQGVRVVHPDGRVTPCELAYRGLADGFHVWATDTHLREGDILRADMVPAGAALTFPMTEDQMRGTD